MSQKPAKRSPPEGTLEDYRTIGEYLEVWDADAAAGAGAWVRVRRSFHDNVRRILDKYADEDNPLPEGPLETMPKTTPARKWQP